MNERYIDSAQKCNQCGMSFLIRTFDNGEYEYLSETCECESEFSPLFGEPSISEIVKTLKPLPNDDFEFFDLYPDDKYTSCFAFYWYKNEERFEAQVKAKTLNEAIGCFLVEHPNMSYEDIFEHCEV